MSAFWFFYNNNRHEEAFYLAEKHGADMNHIDNYGVFPLKKELMASNLALFRQLLEKGANPNMIDEFQRTVLHLACDFAHRKDYREVIRLLMKHGADLAHLDFKQRTPLHYLYIHRNRRHEVDFFEPLKNNQGAAGQSPLELLLTEETKGSFPVNC
jgi:ankyrin repeat protein